MFDTVIRMIDAQGDELPATEFMPAATRNRMLRAIDRWVIGASLAFCGKNAVDCVFIKLSSESLIDKTLLAWLAKAVESGGIPPQQLCFQVSEEDATQYLDANQNPRGRAQAPRPPVRDRELRDRPRFCAGPRARRRWISSRSTAR